MKLKIYTIVFSLFLLTVSIFGQNPTISLSFSGITYGYNAQLSKINIHNIDKDCDTILYWPDTVISFINLGITDIPGSNEVFHLFQNTPNPVTERTSVKIYIQEAGNVQVQISDFSGRTVISDSKELNRGYNDFLFIPGIDQMYFFTAIYKSEKRSIKILGKSRNQMTACSLIYLGKEDNDAVNKFKIASDKFQFSLGDNLELTGYYNDNNAIINDAPMTSKTYTFTFTSSSPTVITLPVTNIYHYKATGGGNVISEGSSPVISRGICWSTSQNPTILGNHSSDGSGPP